MYINKPFTIFLIHFKITVIQIIVQSFFRKHYKKLQKNGLFLFCTPVSNKEISPFVESQVFKEKGPHKKDHEIIVPEV